MPLYVEKGGAKPMYRSEERLLLTEDGKVVKADDPKGKTLLVAEGGELPYADAVKHGLVNDPNAAKQEPKAETSKAEAALPLPKSSEVAEKAADVLPKGVGTETKAATKDAPAKEKSEKK